MTIILVLDLLAIGQSVRLPYVIEEKTIVLTDVHVDGSSEVHRFILDTGAPTAIKSELAAQLGLTTAFTDTITDGNLKAPITFTTCNLRLGDKKFDQVLVAITDADIGLETVCDIDGIIGNNLLSQTNWTISNRQVLINVTTPPVNATKLKLKHWDNGCYTIAPTINNKHLSPFIIDSGADTFMELNKADATTLESSTNTITGKGFSSRTLLTDKREMVDQKLMQIDLLKMKSLELPGVISHISPSQFPFNTLGYEFFEHYELTLLTKDNTIYIKPLTNKYNDPGYLAYGFGQEIIDGRLFVSFVWKNSPAWKAGLRPMDEIIKLNNWLFSVEKSCVAYQQISAILDLTHLNMEIRRDNKSVEFDIEKVKLF